MMPLLVPILLSLGTGFAIVCLSWPRRGLRSELLLKLSLAVGLGLGTSSLIYFLSLPVHGLSRGTLLIIELILLGSLTAALLSVNSLVILPVKDTHSSQLRADDSSSMRWALGAMFCLAVVSTFYVFISFFYNHPHGAWDAWMTWNLRARFFFRAGDYWRDAFSPLLEGAHPEYPVLLPSIVARIWKYVGRETELAPMLCSTLFTFATVALMFSSLCFLRSKSQGFLGGLVLLGTPFFVHHGASQYADVPLSFFFLASLVLLCLSDRVSSGGRGLLFLTGMAVGFGAWTKNEGMLFLVSMFLASAAVMIPKYGFKVYGGKVLGFAPGLLAVLPVIAYFKLQLAAPEPLFVLSRSTLHHLFDWSRYSQILIVFLREGLRFGNWGFDWGFDLVLVLPFYFLLLGMGVKEEEQRGIFISGMTLALTLAGYFAVFLMTHEPLADLLNSTVPRLLFQLWPSAIFLFFLLVRTPEQMLNENSGMA